MDNVITLFISILEENKIVFVSRQYSLLFVATQSLITLLYPFCWHHIYVPVMGTKLKDFVHAPTPFIMGVPKECYDSFKQDLEAVEDVTLVDLDYGRVKRPRGKLVYPKGRDKLVESLRTFLLPQIIDVDADLPEAKETTHINRGIQARFLQFFVELFHDYRKYIAFVRKYPYPITTFDKTSFLTQKPHQDKKFLSVFLDTQTFQVFSEVSPLQHPSIFEYASKKYNERKGKFDAATLVDSPKLRVDETGLQEYKVPLQLQCQPGVRRKAITKPLYKLPEIVTPQPNEPEQKQEGRHAKIRCYPKEEELSVEIGDLRPYSKELWTNNEVDWISAFVDAIFEQNDIAWAVPIFHNVLLMEDGPLVFCTILADYISRNDISILTKTVFDTLSTVLYVVCLYIKDYS